MTCRSLQLFQSTCRELGAANHWDLSLGELRSGLLCVGQARETEMRSRRGAHASDHLGRMDRPVDREWIR